MIDSRLIKYPNEPYPERISMCPPMAPAIADPAEADADMKDIIVLLKVGTCSRARPCPATETMPEAIHVTKANIMDIHRFGTFRYTKVHTPAINDEKPAVLLKPMAFTILPLNKLPAIKPSELMIKVIDAKLMETRNTCLKKDALNTSRMEKVIEYSVYPSRQAMADRFVKTLWKLLKILVFDEW